jgi:hypothetical protein
MRIALGHLIARRSPLVVAVAAIVIALAACELITTGAESTRAPNVPSTFAGRPVDVQGLIVVRSPNVTIYVWDSGTIDGDVVSLALNGAWSVHGHTLTADKRAIHTTLNSSGYSYLLLYAHTEGSLSPNTAAVSIDDGTGEQVLTLSANLLTNGAVSLLVQR